jgi:hypothetical protein
VEAKKEGPSGEGRALKKGILVTAKLLEIGKIGYLLAISSGSVLNGLAAAAGRTAAPVDLGPVEDE